MSWRYGPDTHPSYHSLAKLSGRQTDDIYLFPKKIGFDISYKLSSRETICLDIKVYFLGKSTKNVKIFFSCNFLPSMQCVKGLKAPNKTKHSVYILSHYVNDNSCISLRYSYY